MGLFPFVEALVVLAGEVQAIVGPNVKISYSADWTEYGAYVPADGSADVLFPLDALWASPDVDFVGVDWYPPVGDWRDGDQHLDAIAGFKAADESSYLLANMAGGEAFDWYYADQADRDAQVRTPIVDTAYGEDWIFRAKDLNSWHGASHFERPGGVRVAAPTNWTPRMKPVRLIELGYPAVDRGGNAPNLFFDPKSDESALPPYSSGARDDLFQRRALLVALSYWQTNPAVEATYVWAWDGRPGPHYPVREDVWSDGPNWQLGHWLNGRTGLIELAEIVIDLAVRAGVNVDVSNLEGFVEGFTIEGVSDLRGVLSPLEAAFGLNCVEREGVLWFHHQGRAGVIPLDPEKQLEEGTSVTRALLDKVPGQLVLTYISGTGGYEPALAEARHPAGDRDYTLRLNMPLVMGEGRARDLASALLSQAASAVLRNISQGPEGLMLEAGDQVQDETGDLWQVSEIVDDGLRRNLQLQPDSMGVGAVAVSEPNAVGDAANFPAEPELIVIDGPTLPGRESGQPLVAVSGDPWVGVAQVQAGPDETSLTQRAVAEAPAGIGQLTSDLLAGPLGRWDEAAMIDLEMVGGEFASRSELSVLNGGGLIMVQKNVGWELLAYRTAQLIGGDQWRLSGLLRGLSGSTTDAALTGATVVVADERVLTSQLVRDEVGLPLIWQTSPANSLVMTFDDRAGLSWRVGHLRAQSTAQGWQIDWTRRGANISDSWAFPEAANAGLFRVEALLNLSVLDTVDVSSVQAVVASGADTVRVAEIGADGRMGAWASIPLIAA